MFNGLWLKLFTNIFFEFIFDKNIDRILEVYNNKYYVFKKNYSDSLKFIIFVIRFHDDS